MNKLKVKVCGMRDPQNIAEVGESSPDFMGFIFYPPSKRFVGFEPDLAAMQAVPEGVLKAGVFVDEDPERVMAVCRRWEMDAVQLHGQESPALCRLLREAGWLVLKAFSVDPGFDFTQTQSYVPVVDYFLFDTKGEAPGGTGRKFNWQLLQAYTGSVPFFLSGGIGPDDFQAVTDFEHPQFAGLDINSGFELSPAVKNAPAIVRFLNAIRYGQISA